MPRIEDVEQAKAVALYEFRKKYPYGVKVRLDARTASEDETRLLGIEVGLGQLVVELVDAPDHVDEHAVDLHLPQQGGQELGFEMLGDRIERLPDGGGRASLV